jgi:hypothetical protein
MIRQAWLTLPNCLASSRSPTLLRMIFLSLVMSVVSSLRFSISTLGDDTPATPTCRIWSKRIQLIVNWLEIEIAKPNGKLTWRNSFVTNLPVNRQTVADLVACGRARWKIKNETFNVLKNNGYHLEHNFGHGKDTLASVLVALNLLAFAMHNACDLGARAWQQARHKLGARNRLFTHIWSITAYHLFCSWHALMQTFITGVPPPRTA